MNAIEHFRQWLQKQSTERLRQLHPLDVRPPTPWSWTDMFMALTISDRLNDMVIDELLSRRRKDLTAA